MHPQIDKRAKLGHVADRALQDHALAQVGNILHPFVEARHHKVGARVAARFFQLAQDVAHGDGTKALIGKLLGLQLLEHFTAAHQLGNRAPGGMQNALDHRVGFRVNPGHVQRVVAVANTQEAGRLLKSLGPQAGDLQQLPAIPEAAMGIAPAHHRFGHCAGQAGHPCQQRHRGGIQVHPHRVHAILHHAAQLACQVALVDVVLVLTHTDALGVDLHQLGQRILQAPRNADCTAQAHVQLGQLLAGKLTGRIDRGASLADHYLLQSFRRLPSLRLRRFLP